MNEPIRKYPRTHHVEGSRKQPGDDALRSVPMASLYGTYMVVEEKLDGANAGVSFTERGDLRLQSRGHYLTGGPRERHFNLFKAWAAAHRDVLWAALGSRYTMYGEWMYAKHTVYYDTLPHYFFEFDVLDTSTGQFLDTQSRGDLLAAAPVVSVPVLWRGEATRATDLESLVTTSLYKSADWRDRLAKEAASRGLDLQRIHTQTDMVDEAEGLYLKIEAEGHVTDRLKLVRASFLTAVTDGDSHWLDRPIVPNGLAPGVDLFGAGK